MYNLDGRRLTRCLLLLRSYDYATGELRTGVADQADQALRNIAAALAQVAPDDEHEPVTMADVVRVRYILPDRGLFPQTWPALQRWFGGGGGARPAATMMQAGLLEEAMLIEVEVTARRPWKNDDGVKPDVDVGVLAPPL